LVAELLHFRILAKLHVKMSSNRSKTMVKVVANVQQAQDWLHEVIYADNNSSQL